MDSLLGTSFWVFFVLTVVIVGFAAYMTGQALALTWKPAWQLVVYCLLLAAAARFLVFALYDGALWSLTGYLISAAVLLGIGMFAYRLNRAQKMVSQYPWIYERSSVFGWRSRH